MATINVLVRWADNTEQLRRNLKEGINQLEATKASVESLVKSFSQEKLIQSAHRNVAAIQEYGGAFKLTESQAKRSLSIITAAMEALERQQKPIPDAMKAMRDELEKAVPATNNLALTVGKLAGAFAGMVAIAVAKWMMDGIQAGLQYGDMLVGLRAKTDLSIRDLQILEDIGIDANVSMETLARAVQILQERIGNGTAHKGIRELGLSVDALRQMSPGEMFAAIGASIAKIEDPTLRAAAGAQLMGRSYREVAGALRVDMAEVARNVNAVGDAQAEAADRAVDAWNKFWNDQKRGWTAWAGDIILNIEKVNAAKARLDNFGAEPGLPSRPVPRVGLGNIVNDVDPELVERVTQAQIDAIDERIAATKRAIEEQRRWNEEVKKFSGPSGEFIRQLEWTKFQLNQAADAFLLADQRAIGYLGTIEQLAGNQGQIPTIEVVPPTIGVGTGPAAIPAKTFDESVSTVEVLQKNLRLVDSILSGINAKWAQMATVAVRAIDGVINSLAAGDWIGAITAGVSGLIGLIGGVFRDEVVEAINDQRDAWFNLQGGLETLNPRIQAITGSLELVGDVFAADTPEEYAAAIEAVNETLARNQRVIEDSLGMYGDLEQKFEDIVYLSPALQAALDRALEADTAIEMRDALTDINDELEKQQQQYDDINGLLKKYNIAVSEVNDPAFKQQFIGEQALELRREFDIAKQAAIDMNVFMRAAGKTVNEFVQSAITMGVEVPESMREVIQVAIDAGEIFDANGNKIENMEQLGLTFGQTMQQVVATISTVMSRLLVVLEGMTRFFGVTLPNAAEDGAADIQASLNSIEVPDFTIDVGYNIPDLPDGITSQDELERKVPDYGFMGGLVTEQGIQRFATGGKVLNFVPRGMDTVPAMLAPGEGVVNHAGMGVLGEDGLRALNRGQSGSSGGTVVKFERGAIHIEGSLIQEHDLEKVVGDAAIAAVEKGGRCYGRFSKLVKQAAS